MIDELQELDSAVGRLPFRHQIQIGPLVVHIKERYRQEQRILREIREALADLRLQMKYLIFDLEATRRERDFYKSEQEK